MINLKIERIKKGISQWKMASLLGIDATKLSKIENNRVEPSKKIKKACCKILNKSTRQLFNNKLGESRAE
jgi:DNA-binding XRE family transcriptional regulator